MNVKQKILREFYYGDVDRLPRRAKKAILGKRMSRGKLKRLLDSVTIGEKTKTMFSASDIKPFMFCPKCGHTGMRGTGNRAEYPEHWEYFHCIRCRNVVGFIDNSPFIHALECKEYGYDPTF